ncbi:hypothetical protein MTATph1_CDS0235 [Moorella phage MTATph1]
MRTGEQLNNMRLPGDKGIKKEPGKTGKNRRYHNTEVS